MHQRTAGRVGLLAVEHERQRLVLDLDELGGILGQRAGIRHHRRDPFAGIARHIHGERAPRHVRRVEPGEQRRGRARKLSAVEHIMHTWQGECRGLVDAQDARGRMRARHHRDMLGVRQRHVGGEAALADDEPAVLAHAAVGRDETEFGIGGGHEAK